MKGLDSGSRRGCFVVLNIGDCRRTVNAPERSVPHNREHGAITMGISKLLVSSTFTIS